MIQVLLWLIAIPIVAVLLLFSLRRIIFTLAIFLAAKKRKLPSSLAGIDLPDVLILVSCQNEAGMIHGICWALSQLDYPHAKYQVVLIDDASTDATWIKSVRVVENTAQANGTELNAVVWPT